jgi:hypothetical protein
VAVAKSKHYSCVFEPQFVTLRVRDSEVESRTVSLVSPPIRCPNEKTGLEIGGFAKDLREDFARRAASVVGTFTKQFDEPPLPARAMRPFRFCGSRLNCSTNCRNNRSFFDHRQTCS